jgi:hypothetical protein
MNKILIIVGAAVLWATTASAANIHAREVGHQKRIAQGVRAGSLTPHETARLEHREAKLHREIRRDRLDGRGLTLAERRKIDHKQDQLSRQIYRQKHDGQGW